MIPASQKLKFKARTLQINSVNIHSTSNWLCLPSRIKSLLSIAKKSAQTLFPKNSNKKNNNQNLHSRTTCSLYKCLLTQKGIFFLDANLQRKWTRKEKKTQKNSETQKKYQNRDAQPLYKMRSSIYLLYFFNNQQYRLEIGFSPQVCVTQKSQNDCKAIPSTGLTLPGARKTLSHEYGVRETTSKTTNNIQNNILKNKTEHS